MIEKKGISLLTHVVERLIDPENGCPWDKKQTIESLQQYLLEEVYEVIEGIKESPQVHKEELGDLLFQIVIQSLIRERENRFNFEDVADAISNKLINRHPHIFDENFDSSIEINEKKWEQDKVKEKNRSSLMDDIPNTFPALLRAEKIQRRAASAGFDWPHESGPKDKIFEEIKEIEEAILENDQNHIEEEFGDLLFAMVNWARFFGVNGEVALIHANNKFQNRFRKMEQLAKQKNLVFSELSLEKQEELWIESKKLIK
jgi:nucleoside triphosphate diphosphatase